MILKMSFTAIGFIIMTMVIRKFFLERLPKRVFPILWGMITYRLLVPFTIPRNFPSHMPFHTFVNSGIEKKLEATVPYFYVWVIGVMAIGTYFLYSHFNSKRIYREALPTDNPLIDHWINTHMQKRHVRILQLDKIMTPFTYGLIHPVIILPKIVTAFDRQRLEFILAHEYMHIKYFDILLKWIWAVCLCIHWFNPFVWLAFFFTNRDIELACDESVLRHTGFEHRAAYAFMLIHFKSLKNGPLSLYNGFCKKKSEERIFAIMKADTTTKTVQMMSLLFICLMLTFITTSATAAEPMSNRIPIASKTPFVDQTVPTVTLHWNEYDKSYSAVATDENNHVIFQEHGIQSSAEEAMKCILDRLIIKLQCNLSLNQISN